MLVTLIRAAGLTRCLFLGFVILLAGCSGDKADSQGPSPAAAPPSLSTAKSEDKAQKPEVKKEDEAPVAVAAPAPVSSAPFDVSYLDPDTEVFVVARPAAILKSPLVQTLTGGNLGPVSDLKDLTGIELEQIDTVTVGVKNLQKMAEQSMQPMAGGVPGMNMPAIAQMAPPVDAAQDTIVVVRTTAPVTAEMLGLKGSGTESDLRKRSHESEDYYALPGQTGAQAFLYLANETTLLIATEDVIKHTIEQKASVSSPAVDLSFIPSVPDVLIAVVPKDRKALLASAPGLSGGQQAASSPRPRPNQKQRIRFGKRDDDEDEFDTPAAPPSPPPGTEDTLPALLENHVDALALTLSLESDAKLNVSLRCDSPAASAKIEATLTKAVGSGKAIYEQSRSQLPGVIQQMADAILGTLQTSGSENAITVSAALPQSQFSNLPMLPVVVMGMMMGNSVSAQAVDTFADQQQWVQEVVDRGQPPASGEVPLPKGLELRALAHWADATAPGDQKPSPLEITMIASGDLASRAMSFGLLELNEFTAADGVRWKWLGATPDPSGSNAVHDLVPIDRNGFLSTHPPDGVAIGYRFAPAEPIPTTIPAFSGQFRLKSAQAVREVTIQPIPQPGQAIEDSELRAADFQITAASANGEPSIQCSFRATSAVGPIDVLDSDGNPIPGLKWERAPAGDRQHVSVVLPPATTPAQVGIRVGILGDVEEIPVSFQFENLPLPGSGEITPEKLKSTVWTPAELVPGELPDGLNVEASARWHGPRVIAPSPMGGDGLVGAGQFPMSPGDPSTAGSGFLTEADNSAPTPTRDPSRGLIGLSRDEEEDDDKRLSGRDRRNSEAGASRSPVGMSRGNEIEVPVAGTAASVSSFAPADPEGSLQLVVDLTGPVAKSIVAVGNVVVDSAQAADGGELTFLGSRCGSGNLSDSWTELGPELMKSPDQPPDGFRTILFFSAPNPPTEQISRFVGSLQVRTVREKVDAIISNLNERSNRRIRDRNLTRFGLEIAVLIEEDQMLFRLLEGEEERIAELYPVDGAEVRIANVTHTTLLDNGNLIHRFAFPGRIPDRVGLKLSLNLGVQETTVPLRFQQVPVPPQPQPAFAPEVAFPVEAQPATPPSADPVRPPGGRRRGGKKDKD